VVLGVLEGSGEVVPLALTRVELALTGSLQAAGAPGVEAQHGQTRERRQPPGRLAEQVAVHHAAVRRQRMEADQSGDRVTLRR